MKHEPLTTAAEVRARTVPEREDCRIEMIPGGPALVRGAASVEDDAGTRHTATRPVVGVCTCGLTQRAPWCDATHKLIPS